MPGSLRHDRVSLTSRVPRAKQIDTAGEEAGLEDTENHAQRSELAPLLDETHPNHYRPPQQGDAGHMDARTQLANDDGRGWLEDGVRDEEDEGDDALGVY